MAHRFAGDVFGDPLHVDGHYAHEPEIADPKLNRSSEVTRRLLEKWGRLHAVRSVLSLVASCMFLSLVIRV